MAIMDNLCMGCMKEKNGPICHACGYNEDEALEISNNIPLRTVLANRYLIGKVLGVGGFGTTYIGFDKNTNKKVAIKEYMPRSLVYRVPGEKEIKTKSNNSKETYYYGLEKYVQEAGILSRFQGIESIVQIFDCFEENNTAYIVMEYLDGVTLIDYVKHNDGRIGVPMMLKLISPILEALGHVHKAGLVHRDISPDNIFITNKGYIKLLDFGAARYSLGQKSNNLSVILKPGYAPPEQYFTKGKQGPWTDVYGIAATMYRCICGQMPVDSMQRMENDSLINPSMMEVDINHQVESAIIKALALQHTNRYQTAEEFHNALFLVETVETVEQTPQTEVEIKEEVYINDEDNREQPNSSITINKKLLSNIAWISMIILTIIIFIANISPYYLAINILFILTIISNYNHKVTENNITQIENRSSSVEQHYKPNLIGLSGQFQDMRITLDDDYLVLGRDSSISNLVFSTEEQDISRRHCAIKYDNAMKKFILLDYSTYGTFLAKGKRLIKEKEYYFDNDVTFYLVSKSNTFRLLLEKGEV